MALKTMLSTNTKVEVVEQGDVPGDVKWVRDIRVNPRTRRELITGFWKHKRGITGHVAYVASEGDRIKLRREGKVRIQLRDPSAQSVMVIVPERLLREAR